MHIAAGPHAKDGTAKATRRTETIRIFFIEPLRMREAPAFVAGADYVVLGTLARPRAVNSGPTMKSAI